MLMKGFNSLIHEPNRLKICGVLFAIDAIEFRVLAEQMMLSDSALSKHLKSLEQADFITQHKRKRFGRPRTLISMNEPGRSAFLAHIEALKTITGEIK